MFILFTFFNCLRLYHWFNGFIWFNCFTCLNCFGCFDCYFDCFKSCFTFFSRCFNYLNRFHFLIFALFHCFHHLHHFLLSTSNYLRSGSGEKWNQSDEENECRDCWDVKETIETFWRRLQGRGGRCSWRRRSTISWAPRSAGCSRRFRLLIAGIRVRWPSTSPERRSTHPRRSFGWIGAGSLRICPIRAGTPVRGPRNTAATYITSPRP